VRTFSRQRERGGFSDADVRTLWCKKLGFSKFVVCLHGQGGGGLSQCGHFADKGGGDRDFLRASFMDAQIEVSNYNQNIAHSLIKTASIFKMCNLLITSNHPINLHTLFFWQYRYFLAVTSATTTVDCF